MIPLSAMHSATKTEQVTQKSTNEMTDMAIIASTYGMSLRVRVLSTRRLSAVVGASLSTPSSATITRAYGTLVLLGAKRVQETDTLYDTPATAVNEIHRTVFSRLFSLGFALLFD